MPIDNMTPKQAALALQLYKKSLPPLYTSLASLTWILFDYFVTLEDEVRYIWPQRRNLAKISYLWTRYYSLALLAFDVCQIHIYARPGVTNNDLCIITDPITRVTGGILLWSVEIIMMLRIYALYGCSKVVAIFNFTLFLATVGIFFWIVVVNTEARKIFIKDAFVQWIPATVFEGILFGFALWKSITTTAERWNSGVSMKRSVMSVVTRDNILYFFGVGILLMFNNLMVVGVTRIPWFSFGPFHAALGIMTGRMLMHLRKATVSDNFVTDYHIANTDYITQDQLQFGKNSNLPSRTTGTTMSISTAEQTIELDESPVEGKFRKKAKDLETGMSFAKRSQISTFASDF